VVLKQAREPISPSALACRAKLTAAQAETLLSELRLRGAALDAGGAVVHADLVADAAGEIAKALAAFHAANPMRLGAEEAELAGQVHVPSSVFQLAVNKLAADGAIERHDRLLAVPGKGSSLPGEQLRLCERIETAIRAGGLAPPLAADLAESLGEPTERIEAAVRLLADRRAVVRLDARLAFHAEAVERAKAVAMELFAQAGSFTTMQFRDALGVSRKYAVPLLDYLDSIRLTARSGNLRRPGAKAGKRPG